MIRDSAPADVGHNSFHVEVVKNMDQLIQIFALRAICFMEDTGLPYDHAFDGNDLQATHVVGYDGIEPVGTMRIRWFKDFAKIERTAFRTFTTAPFQYAAEGDVAIHACGPPGMLEAVRRIGVERGVPTQLALESPMACGFGACFGCVTPLAQGGYARVCVDGPVFAAAELAEVPAH